MALFFHVIAILAICRLIALRSLRHRPIGQELETPRAISSRFLWYWARVYRVRDYWGLGYWDADAVRAWVGVGAADRAFVEAAEPR